MAPLLLDLIVFDCICFYFFCFCCCFGIVFCICIIIYIYTNLGHINKLLLYWHRCWGRVLNWEVGTGLRESHCMKIFKPLSFIVCLCFRSKICEFSVTKHIPIFPRQSLKAIGDFLFNLNTVFSIHTFVIFEMLPLILH